MTKHPQRPTKIALFGGSFDPVHRGHIKLACAAREALNLDQVRFLPCRQSPHKPSQAPAASAHRLAMLRLATQELSWSFVDTHELRRPLPSYSYLSARAYKKMHPEGELFWIMGGDQWAVLDHWAEWQELAKFVHFIVFQRGDHLVPREGVRASLIQADFPFSATAIRSGGRSTGIDSVDEYLKANGVYR